MIHSKNRRKFFAFKIYILHVSMRWVYIMNIKLYFNKKTQRMFHSELSTIKNLSTNLDLSDSNVKLY